ncbi:PIG-L deacetylase family protein [Emticicia sp. 17c]|uniref:PIG-L deacetylase family protein n=1 Tax=Emticicia sp. 17c TaxID=3127704 RepID=UPI00301C9F79
MKKLVYALVILLLVVAGLFFYLRSQLQDDSVPMAEGFSGQKVMFIFPHPDDEITSAGTLKLLDQQGIETSLITFTHGEAGGTNGLVQETDPLKKKTALAKIREKELRAVGQLLGVDNQEILDFADSGISLLPPDTLKKVIRQKIARYQPTVLITYDDVIGLYGHPDHRLIAQYTKEIFLAEKGSEGFPVKKLYQVTLPKPMIETAKKISASFKRNFSKNATLPTPTMAIKISAVGAFKKQAMLLHVSQRPTFNDMQPYFDKIPVWIYYRIFDKEYFSEVK